MMDANDRDKVEHWVIGACQGLGLPVQDAEADFFAAGGSSLTAVKLISQVEEQFGEDTLPPEDLFERSTIREMAETIQRNGARAGASNSQ